MIGLVSVDVRDEEDIQVALKRFKRKCIKESIPQDIRKNAYYEKPSVRKRKKHLKAVKRQKKNRSRG
ncbi:MAG TPA: 30S ribosomal protein S21 [bacterium]|nr:30S ribosomal protein S21 [bacterium]HOL92870.1 30S ribosomal protein S21 [bacterium]HPO99933.1 30S ribosomal protein S21 [bacterium]